MQQPAADQADDAPAGEGARPRSAGAARPDGLLVRTGRSRHRRVTGPRGPGRRGRLMPLWSACSSRSATGPRSGNSASGRGRATGAARRRARAARGCGQAEGLLVAAPVADDDQVDVEGARRVLDLAALTLEGVLDRQRAVHQPGGGQRGVHQHDGVEVVLRLGRAVDRLGLVDRGDAGDPHVRGVGERVDGALEAGHPLPEVGPERQHRPTDRAHLAGQRVGVDDVGVGGLSHGGPHASG